MEKRWVHPLFKPSKRSSRELRLFVSKGNFVSGRSTSSELISYVPFQAATCVPVPFGSSAPHTNNSKTVNYRLTLFIVSALIAVAFSVSAIFLKAKFTYSPRIAGLDLGEFQFQDDVPLNKDAFLARLNNQSRRQLASQVHYVHQLINNPRLSEDEAKKLASLIVMESAQAGYDPLFITSIIKSESTFNHHAVSYAGAMGLMQIMPDTGRFVSRLKNVEWKGSHRLRDPEYNIRMGIAYLKHLEDSFDGNRELMLIAYNWGPKNVFDALQSRKRIPLSCVRYAKTILTNQGRWKNYFAKNMAQFQYMDLDVVS